MRFAAFAVCFLFSVSVFSFFPPNHISKSSQKNQVKSYFTYWKSKYLKSATSSTGKKYYYVSMQGIGPDGDSSITSSEAHGYGMILLVSLSGFDAASRSQFDGFVRMYNDFRSTGNSANMSWIVHKNLSSRYGSATDGDIDIAYALLLAHKKWGSTTTFNYLALAKKMIQNGVKASDFTSSGRTNLGDWDDDAYNSRSSDWMPGHFQSFYKYTGDTFWLGAINTVYGVVQRVQTYYSPNTGLMPDFIIGSEARPAPANYLDEGTTDYSWNACRYPMRLALDAKFNNRAEAKNSLDKSLKWLVGVTKGDPRQIKAGYYLNGQPQVTYTSAAFVAPWVMAATTHSKYQSFINKGWDSILQMKSDYYSDSITLMALTFMSELWVAP